MLDTLRTVHPKHYGEVQTRTSSKKQQSLYLLQKYGNEIAIEYQSALLQYDEDEKKSKDIHAKLATSLFILASEKAQLQKDINDLSIRQQRAEWQNRSLDKKLAEQQQQLNTIRQQRQREEDEESLLREQNLRYLTEKQALVNKLTNEEESLNTLALQKSQLQSAIQRIKCINEKQNDLVARKSELIVQREESNEAILNQIEQNEQMIEKNTAVIEKALTKQNSLSKYFGELKRKKKQLSNKIKEITPQLSQEQTIADRLIQLEHALLQKHSQTHYQQQQTHQQIGYLQTVCMRQKGQFAYNNDCLAKLSSHLQALRVQNQKIESYMETVLEQDYRIKEAIDRKHTYQRRKDEKEFENTRSSLRR